MGFQGKTIMGEKSSNRPGLLDEAKFTLLFVDDDPHMLSILQDIFSKQGYGSHVADSGQEALTLLEKERIDVALVDLMMPHMDGFALLERIKTDFPETMVIMLTGHGGVKEAVAAIKEGAIDFIEKPFNSDGLRARILQLYQIWELKRENRDLKHRLKFHFGFAELIGTTRVMSKLKEMVTQVGPTDLTVLIHGETGTGKELIARAVHYHSSRSKNSFMPVDCAAISESVMESELFGHVKGAFTGAHISTLGLIRSADKGTLFLDEVGELSPAIQVKLLRTIQEREVRPVGSSRSYLVDVRIIAATNRDLAGAVAEGKFREDLFYRLNTLTMTAPPLRDRKEDIPLLTNYFLKRFSNNLSPGKVLSPDALASLEHYDWPGNVRELENVISRAVALSMEEIINAEDFPPTLQFLHNNPLKDPLDPSEDTLAAYETTAIKNALAKSKHNRKLTAQILGIGEATLYRKIKKYQLSR